MAFYIKNKDWKKVIDYAQASYDEFKSEVGGFLIATKDKDGDYIISDPEILKQEVTGGTTEMDKAAIADYYVKSCMEHGKDVRFVWWHSHANMAAFWSGTDTSTMKEYSSGDWSAFLVVNIKGESKFRVCLWDPIDMYKDTELTILGEKERTVPKAIVKQVTELCEKPRYTATTATAWKDRITNGVATNGYGYNHNQLALNNTTPIVDSEDSGWSDNLGEPIHDSTIEILAEWNDLYREGFFTFKEWLKEVKKWNTLLKRKQASFLIKELTEHELHLNAGYYTSYNVDTFIIYGEENEPNIKV